MIRGNKGFVKRTRRILYLLRKKTNRQLHEFSFGEGKQGKKRAMDILRRLIKKGLVASTHHYGSNDIYYLTDEGKKVADEIVMEIDEYKRW